MKRERYRYTVEFVIECDEEQDTSNIWDGISLAVDDIEAYLESEGAPGSIEEESISVELRPE